VSLGQVGEREEEYESSYGKSVQKIIEKAKEVYFTNPLPELTKEQKEVYKTIK